MKPHAAEAPPPLPDFLAPLAIEIGVEELPAGAMPGILDHLRHSAEAFFERERLEPSHLFVGGTCRRLVVLADSVLKQQEDRVVTHKGPPEKVLKDASGQWTPQAEGFARKFGKSAADLVIHEGYATLEVLEQGQPATVLLGRFVREFLDKCPLPKRMTWGDEITFLRPVRWVLGLVGTEAIAFATQKVKAGHTTHEPRARASKPLSFLKADEYAPTLHRLGVELDPAKRLHHLKHLVAETLTGSGLTPLAHDEEELLAEVNWLVETPTAALASFEPAFREVPPEVIRVVLMRHQRYLPLVDQEEENPANYSHRFVVVLDRTAGADLTTALAGHERVVRARLSDALFFWRADVAEPLDSPRRQEKLKDIVFHPKIGSLWEKQERVARAAKKFYEGHAAAKALVELLIDAAWLYRQDRATFLVGEFPELEGAIGARLLLAKNQPKGLAITVAEAMGLGIFDSQDRERLTFGSELARCWTGRDLLVLDRLDTLAHFFHVGIEPTASEDPFGLRRTAVQLLRQEIEGRGSTSLPDAFRAVLDSPQFGDDKTANKKLGEKIALFLNDRLPSLLQEKFPQASMAFIHAALKGSNILVHPNLAIEPNHQAFYSQPPIRLQNLLAQAEDLEALKTVATAAIRVQNIGEGKSEAALSPTLPDWARDNRPWVALHEFAVQWIQKHLDQQATPKPDFAQENWALAQTGAPLVNNFFDHVLVNDEDPQKRADNHNLVGALALLYGTLGDFRELKSLLSGA